MKTRLATIMAEQDLGASGTKIIDINIKDVISRITVKFYAQNVDVVYLAHPVANIEKIELVDGSDVLFSLTGFQAQALNFYDRGKVPFTYLNVRDDGGQQAQCGMDFGRVLFDPVLAFDPTKFINPQLKITFDRTNANAGCLTSNCEVLADIFDEDPPTPTGFLMSKEIYSYTVGTTGYEYIDLPTDYVTRQIFAKAFLAPWGMTGIFDAFKLSEDNDKRVPVDVTSSVLEKRAFETYGPVEEWVKAVVSIGGIDFYGMPTDGAFGVISPEVVLQDVGVESVGGGKYRFEAEAAVYRARAVLIGNCPHGTIPLLPKPGPEITDWYDVTKLGSLKLRIDDGAEDADTYTGEVMVQQYRPF
ncbi:hypothetical protein ES703_54960 [subsurface metagenome]